VLFRHFRSYKLAKLDSHFGRFSVHFLLSRTMVPASVAPSTMALSVATSHTQAPSSLNSKILQATLKKDDLEFDLQNDAFLSDFERSWKRFLCKHPNCLQAPRQSRIQQLEKQLEETQLSKETLQAEIEQQMNFFTSSCEQLQNEYAHKMQQGTDRQAAVQEELTKRI
jgi:TolA-binding protein